METLFHRITKLKLPFLALLFALDMYLYGGLIPGVKNAIVLATSIKPEPFTELYFEDHGHLPKTGPPYVETGFTFTIHNLEHKKTVYPYVVYLETDSKDTILDNNDITVSDGAYASIRENFSPTSGKPTKVVVDILNKKQSIDFWMNSL
jgi:hypothetical protein